MVRRRGTIRSVIRHMKVDGSVVCHLESSQNVSPSGSAPLQKGFQSVGPDGLGVQIRKLVEW